MRLFINQTVGDLIREMQYVDLQFIYIKSNHSADNLLSNFDIDVVQLSFNGEILYCTIAALQAIRTSTIINYSLNNNEKEYGRLGVRINKYMKHGFRLLTPASFNIGLFENSSMHLSNQNMSLYQQENNNNEYRPHVQLSIYDHNYLNTNEYSNIIWSQNNDCFCVQQKFRSKILF